MSVLNKVDHLAVYRKRFPEHGLVTIHVTDWVEMDRLLEAAVKRGKPLSQRELESVGAIDADDVPEGVFV